MEFPIEIQMLINDFLSPITRTDWRQGSFIIRHYKKDARSLIDLSMYEDFKEYIYICRMDQRFLPNRRHRQRNHNKYKLWAREFSL